LGTIYEDYIERVDKKNKGQYYTPREIVNFIWNRVGYNNPKAFFWHIEGKRRPNFILDPATGSGGFLVEAARRIREYPNFDWDEPQDLRDIHDAILWGIFGSEISLFPYYLTQVNLLIQLTPVIRKHIELTGKKPRKEPTPLGVICRDSMELHNEEQKLFEEGIEEEKKEGRREIIRFTKAEEKIYGKIKDIHAGKFSFVCANPPYVGEKGHKELFRQTLNSYPYWKKYYQGKMDYLYWFIILGLSKLRQWGKLGYITSAYWPTADGASKLRKHILNNAKIKEMVFFEEVKIFEHAKGQHNMVFVLTKCSGEDKKEERENNHIKIVQVKCKNRDLPGETIRENLAFLTQHIQEHIDKSKYEDEYIKVFWSGVKQGELPKDGGAWSEILAERSFKNLFQKLEKKGEVLQNLCNIIRGVDSSADRVTPKNISSLPNQKIEQHGIKNGDGIFLLTENERESLQLLPNELELVKPTYKNSDIYPYFVDIEKNLFIIYTKKESQIDLYPNILNHLEKFREIMENRGEHTKGESGWYALHRPRDEKLLCSKKIVCSRWGEKGPNYFGFQTGEYYEGTDTRAIIPKDSAQEDIFYILAILNSTLIKKWLGEKAQRRGYTAQSTLFQVPIHRINFDNPKEVSIHDEIGDKVKFIMENMSELAKYSKYFSGLRLTKLEFDTPLPEVNDEVIIKSIAGAYSLRTHPEIKIKKPKDFEDEKFYLSKVDKPELTLTGNVQVNLKGKNGTSVFIEGPRDLLTLLADILSLSNWKNKSWSEIKEKPLLPDNIVSFNAQKTRVLNEVRDERAKILQLQTEIDQLVYKLYGLSENEIEIVNSKSKT
jgi:hypothetical protein